MNKKPAHYIGDGDPRDNIDFYPTPIGAIMPLFDHVVMFPGNIWEPACGNGVISEFAKTQGYEVVSSDLHDHGYGTSGVNFFDTTVMPDGCETIITNPAYQIKHEGKTLRVEDWIEHAWKLPNITMMALLLKTTAIAGKKRSVIVENSNLMWLLQFRGRLAMYKNGVEKKGNNMIDFAWYIFDKRYNGYPQIKWIQETK